MNLGFLARLNPFQADFDIFNKAMNDTNKIINEINSQMNFDPHLQDKINNTVNNQKMIEEVKKVIESSNYNSIPKELANSNTVDIITTTSDSSKWSAIQSIGDFCKGVMWIFQNPYECLKLVLGGVSDIVGLSAQIVCAGAILMAIFGHKEALKYMPIAIIIHILLKLVVVLL